MNRRLDFPDRLDNALFNISAAGVMQYPGALHSAFLISRRTGYTVERDLQPSKKRMGVSEEQHLYTGT